MEKFQPKQEYYSDTGLLIAKVKSANGTMCVGSFFEYDIEKENFEFLEDFILSHETLMEILQDGDNGDDDNDGQAQIVFTPEW